MKGNFKATEALVLLDSMSLPPEFSHKFGDSVAAEFRNAARADVENAVRAILVGIGLHAVKKSLKHGEFTAWKKKHLTQGHYWTEATALKNASFYMRLAIHALQDLKPTKGELAHLTNGGDLTMANVTKSGNIRQLVERLTGFVGERTLTDLLDEYGIRDASHSSGGAKAVAALPADDDTLAEDTGQLFLNFDQLLLSPDNLKRFPKAKILQLRDELRARARRFEQLVEKILNQESA